MNVRKRGLALLMCICMIFTLLPFSALADATTQVGDIAYGKYGDDGWSVDDTLTAPAEKEYTNSDTGADVKYSKTAAKNDDGSYTVTLKIKSTTSKTAPGASAVVLVIDSSRSMEGGRLEKALDAAKSFAESYGATAKSGRYIAAVEFSNKASSLNFGTYTNPNYWLDVANADNLRTFKNGIADWLYANGGTDLAYGLRMTGKRFDDNTVKNISNRYAVVLTDGQPDSLYDADPEKTATDAAKQLRNKAEIYTVGVGLNDYTKYFLENSIASKADGKTYAYNVSDSDDLNKTFSTIFKEIDKGISSGFTVTDPMSDYVTLNESSITGNGASVKNGTITWTPTSGETVTNENGSKTTTYTLTYKVTLKDKDVDTDDYYPLNKDTTLTFTDGKKADGSDYNVTLKFNVPGVYREAPKYTVTYAKGEHGNLEGQDNSGNVVHPNLKKGDLTPDAPKVNADEGYYFKGWEPERAATVTGNAVYTAKYAEKYEITVVANSGEVFYNGNEQSITGLKQTEFTFNGKVYKVSGLTASVSGTDANDYTNKVTGTAVVTDADGNDVTNQFTVNTQDGTLKIKPIEITLKSASDQKQYDGTPLTNSNVTVTKGAFVDGEGYTANVTGSQTLVGSSENTFTYTLNEGTKAQNYDITTEKGTLKVIDRTEKYKITVEANSGEATYDGEEHIVSGFKTLSFTIDGNTYTVSGLSASVKGIDAKEYPNVVTGTAVVKDANGNDVTDQFTVKTENGTLTINKATVTITADNQEKYVGANDPELTYTVSGIVNADKDKGLDKKVSVDLAREKGGTPEGELVGTYDIIPSNASIEGSDNYTFKYEKGTLTIKDREAKEIKLTATKLMDGEDATGSDFKFELYQIVGGEEKHIAYANNTGKTITFTREAHSTGDYWYYIREVAGDKTSINYDETVYAAKVTVTNDDVAGSYSYTVQYYKVVDGKEIVEADGNAAVFNNTTKPGSLVVKKTVSGNAASTANKFLFAITLTNDEAQENAAGKTLTVPFNPDQNYVIFYSGIEQYMTDGKLTIKVELKADQKITIRGLPDGIDYTVQELDSNGYTVSATVDGKTATLTNNMLGGTIAAGAETKVVFKNTKNYVYPPNPPIMDEIIVEITGNSDSVVYDGTEHSVKGYTVKISDPRYTEKDFTFTGKAEASGVNAGTYEMGLKAEQFKNTNARFTNVKFVIKADGVLTITPKELTITAGSKTEYGPTPVTCDEWTVSGLVAGDKVESVKITGIQSVPGSSPNVPSDAVIKNAKGEDVTKNYAIKYVNGTLTMLEVLNKEDHFNYIIGTPEGLSLPTANVTRAEVATIFFRLMTDDARAKFDSLDNNFSDVAKGKWYNRAISTLANAGIIKGDPAGTYRPGDPITRAEMAAIIARFGDFKDGGKTFSDISGHWAQKYIELAASNGWINGNPDGTFKPNNNITRAETVAMINRVLNRQTESNDDLLPVAQMTNWSDNMDTAKWYYRDMQEATNNHKAERVGNSIYEKWTEKLPDIDWASYQI